MTFNQLMDRFGVPAGARYAVTGMCMLKGISLDDDVRIKFDRDAGSVRVSVAEQTLEATFDQIEAGFSDDRPGPAVDCGNPAGPGDLPG